MISIITIAKKIVSLILEVILKQKETLDRIDLLEGQLKEFHIDVDARFTGADVKLDQILAAVTIEDDSGQAVSVDFQPGPVEEQPT